MLGTYLFRVQVVSLHHYALDGRPEFTSRLGFRAPRPVFFDRRTTVSAIDSQ
jgi:hypothetical protein